MTSTRPGRPLNTRSESETRELGARLASCLELPCVILLEGDLGSGKTTFVKGLVTGLGGDSKQVHSPTFSLVNQYQTLGGEVIHIDLYRLDDSRQQYSIGLDELLDSDGLVVVEWAEKLRLEVDQPLEIQIHSEGPELRCFRLLNAPSSFFWDPKSDV